MSLHRPIEIKGDYYDPFSDVIIFSRFCSWKNNTTQSIYVGKNNVTFSHLHFMTIFYVCIPFYISKYLLSSNFKNNLKVLSQKHSIFRFFFVRHPRTENFENVKFFAIPKFIILTAKIFCHQNETSFFSIEKNLCRFV